MLKNGISSFVVWETKIAEFIIDWVEFGTLGGGGGCSYVRYDSI
jgi:hypothetical protein